MTEFIDIVALGAGQEVGRSCIAVKMRGKTIVFDSGIHMLYSDERRYPNFNLLYQSPNTINDVVSLVLITHFHLDHSGGLPFLVEKHKYEGPVYATAPTKAMIPYMLQDLRKVSNDVRKQENQYYIYTQTDIKNAVSKMKSIGLEQTITIDGIKVTSYYAGHVLGACMFFVEYEGLSVLYTGDYNSYADRHLGAAYAPRLNPNVIITETTYATTIRDTKRDRQRNMIKIITQSIKQGGKILIPVFALGRAQELAVLLETYWNRTNNTTPIYFSAGLIDKANFYYKLFVTWENEKIKEQFRNGDNVFDFKHVKPFAKELLRSNLSYVLFATPGMLHGGTSMQAFKEWCGDSKNTLIIPGYCVEGTLGNKLLKNVKQVNIDKKLYEIKMRVENISFSAHADAKGIINLIRHVNADNIVFVHGDKTKMEIFAEVVKQQLQKDVFMPSNEKPIRIEVNRRVPIQIDPNQLVYPKGYIISKPNKYHLIQQQHLLSEANQLMALVDPHLIIHHHVHTQLHIKTSKALQPYLYPNLKIQMCLKTQIKNEEMEFPKIQEEQQQQISIVGNLNDVLLAVDHAEL